MRIYFEYDDFVEQYDHRQWVELWLEPNLFEMDGQQIATFNAELKSKMVDHDRFGIGYSYGDTIYTYGTMTLQKMREIERKIDELEGGTVL